MTASEVGTAAFKKLELTQQSAGNHPWPGNNPRRACWLSPVCITAIQRHTGRPASDAVFGWHITAMAMSGVGVVTHSMNCRKQGFPWNSAIPGGRPIPREAAVPLQFLSQQYSDIPVIRPWTKQGSAALWRSIRSLSVLRTRFGRFLITSQTQSNAQTGRSAILPAQALLELQPLIQIARQIVTPSCPVDTTEFA